MVANNDCLYEMTFEIISNFRYKQGGGGERTHKQMHRLKDPLQRTALDALLKQCLLTAPTPQQQTTPGKAGCARFSKKSDQLVERRKPDPPIKMRPEPPAIRIREPHKL